MSSTTDLFNKYPNKIFVETGTHEGGGVICALYAGFSRIYTIELGQELYQRAVKKFEDYPHIACLWGNSKEQLESLMKEITEPTTFWLDAHYSGGQTAKGEKLCPVIDELEVIKSHPIKTHTILIDDRRLLGTEEFNFVTEAEVIQKLMEINPNYQILFDSSVRQYPDDIIVAKV